MRLIGQSNRKWAGENSQWLLRMESMRRCLSFVMLWFALSAVLRADDATFDLIGPKVDVRVKRGEHTLPIAQVPNLMVGDRLWIHPDFPESQSAHYVLVVAFLRGATNPPPNDWFTRVESWAPGVRQEGVFVTVPKGAEQAILFLAPETGGDFNTLRKTVHDRPGSFVRATQDLQAASWERLRLEAYLAEVKANNQTDLKALKERAELAARSLGIKVNESCFDKPAEQRIPCLMQHTEGMVLDDSNVQSVAELLANGSTTDLMNQISSSSIGHGGAYSPYIGAVVDTAKILSSLHTAKYQYIPALALSSGDTLNLKLNTAPSFRDPKSVVVIALPPLAESKPPAMHQVAGNPGFCAQKPGLVLPVEGAPMAFASPMASNLKLVIEAKSGPIEIPLKADSSQGGLLLEHAAPVIKEPEVNAVMKGRWGFDEWEGPRFHLHNSVSGGWTVSAEDQSALVVGREDTVHLGGAASYCLDRVEKQMPAGDPLKLVWKQSKPDQIEVTVPLKDAQPGMVTLNVVQYGLEKPEPLELKAYSEAAALEKLTLSAGDHQAVLKGTRLDEVASATLDGISLTPEDLSRVQDADLLTLKADKPTTALDPMKRYQAVVELRDGRKIKVKVTVDPPRPQVVLLNKGTQYDAFAPASPVHLGSPDDLSVEGRLIFFLKSVQPASFPRDQKVEVAADDGSFRTMLSLSDGSLILEDARTALGTIDPLQRFGPSAFGPIKLRVVGANGITGEWIELGTLVRVPVFKELRCGHAAAKSCVLAGSNLFLLTAISASQNLDSSSEVPLEFTGTQLAVPHPANGNLYIKLRDDSTTVHTLTLPVNVTAPAPVLPAAPGTVPGNGAAAAPPPPPATAPAAAPDASSATAAPAVAMPTAEAKPTEAKQSEAKAAESKPAESKP